jgi:hypothetical protein
MIVNTTQQADASDASEATRISMGVGATIRACWLIIQQILMQVK